MTARRWRAVFLPAACAHRRQVRAYHERKFRRADRHKRGRCRRRRRRDLRRRQSNWRRNRRTFPLPGPSCRKSRGRDPRSMSVIDPGGEPTCAIKSCSTCASTSTMALLIPSNCVASVIDVLVAGWPVPEKRHSLHEKPWRGCRGEQISAAQWHCGQVGGMV